MECWTTHKYVTTSVGLAVLAPINVFALQLIARFWLGLQLKVCVCVLYNLRTKFEISLIFVTTIYATLIALCLVNNIGMIINLFGISFLTMLQGLSPTEYIFLVKWSNQGDPPLSYIKACLYLTLYPTILCCPLCCIHVLRNGSKVGKTISISIADFFNKCIYWWIYDYNICRCEACTVNREKIGVEIFSRPELLRRQKLNARASPKHDGWAMAVWWERLPSGFLIPPLTVADRPNTKDISASEVIVN